MNFSVFRFRSVKMSTPKQKRDLFYFKQKREIVDYATKHPKSTRQQIADYFSIFGELPVKHRTVRGSYQIKKFTLLRMIRELPANDILHVNKFNDLQKLYLQTIISVCHICIMKYFFYKLK